MIRHVVGFDILHTSGTRKARHLDDEPKVSDIRLTALAPSVSKTTLIFVTTVNYRYAVAWKTEGRVGTHASNSRSVKGWNGAGARYIISKPSAERMCRALVW